MFEQFEGKWQGQGELWLDPLGNDATKSEVTAVGDGTRLVYSWSHEGTAHNGSFSPIEDGVRWADSFHQADGANCAVREDAWGHLNLEHEYHEAGWRWRTRFSTRPDESLVIQMTNIAPWGEEARAVRMVFKKL